jgi:hypothetical protein
MGSSIRHPNNSQSQGQLADMAYLAVKFSSRTFSPPALFFVSSCLRGKVLHAANATSGRNERSTLYAPRMRARFDAFS